MLKDRYDRKLNYLRLSVTDRCNLRCTYCMPEKGIPMIRPDEIMTKQEILTLARAFLELGVTKVRLTGGEPTLRGDLSKIIRELKVMGAEQVVLTTNGILLRDKAK
ncbi:MAG: radical SAM protein, partial [Clostridiaceae bacterium]